VQSRRSLWTNVAGEAWRAAGTGRRRDMCLRSWVMLVGGQRGLYGYAGTGLSVE
jgi:hypothetical protein